MTHHDPQSTTPLIIGSTRKKMRRTTAGSSMKPRPINAVILPNPMIPPMAPGTAPGREIAAAATAPAPAAATAAALAKAAAPATITAAAAAAATAAAPAPATPAVPAAATATAAAAAPATAPVTPAAAAKAKARATTAAPAVVEASALIQLERGNCHTTLPTAAPAAGNPPRKMAAANKLLSVLSALNQSNPKNRRKTQARSTRKEISLRLLSRRWPRFLAPRCIRITKRRSRRRMGPARRWPNQKAKAGSATAMAARNTLRGWTESADRIWRPPTTPGPPAP